MYKHPSKLQDDKLSSLATGRRAIHSGCVTVDELRKPEVASALEWCFLAALASYITYDRVVPLPQDPPPQLENKEHEKLATALGNLFVEHVRIVQEQRDNYGKKSPDLPDEQVIRDFARYMYPRSGNVYENGIATGAFAKELQRALEDPTGVQLIAATSPDMPNCVLGLATCEHYTLQDQKTGLYIRELMISPFHRSGSVVRTLVDEIMRIAAGKDEITTATSHRDTLGDLSRTFRLYRKVGFTPIEAARTVDAAGGLVLAENAAMESQGLKSPAFVAMKADFSKLLASVKKLRGIAFV